MSSLRHAAREIFAETLKRVEVRSCVRERIICDATTLTVDGVAASLAEIEELLIVAVGKAAMAMYEGAEDALQAATALRVGAIVVAPKQFEARVRGEFFAGAHPTPDASSRAAAAAILQLLQSAGPRTGVLFLISGGASAMVELPLDERISVEDTAAFHRALVASGLPIAEMNALRKHFSAVKGGRLAEVAAAAKQQWTLLVSDVPAATPDAIASGPSLPDSSTVAECRALLEKVTLPARVEEFFASEQFVETPKAGDAAFARASWSVLLSSEQLVETAAAVARERGFEAIVDNGCDEWEYRDAGIYLLGKLEARAGKRCLISVGEVSVTLPAEPGDGGRNQQFALWCAEELRRRKVSACVLSAGTDGIDGVSSAAGAVADETTVERAAAEGFTAAVSLREFDAAPLFAALGDDVTTGPTGNNLRDLRLLLAE